MKKKKIKRIKQRDANTVSAIRRKAGPHKDKRKKRNKDVKWEYDN